MTRSFPLIPLLQTIRALRLLALATGAIWCFSLTAHADTANVVTAANTLLATSEAANPDATSTSTIPAVMTDSYTLAIAKQWTNLPGGTRNGPTIGGGPAALSTDLSNTVPSGQTISPRAAAIALAETALSAAGYNTMNEIRNADDVIRSTDNTQSWNYGNYHIAILGTPSTTATWMLQISGHHLTYNITYNGPYMSATPMFIGTEPPNYFSIGTDLTTSELAVVFGSDDPTSTGGGGGGGGPGGPGGGFVVNVTPTTLTADTSFISAPYNSSSSTSIYDPTTSAAALTASATAISGATGTTYSIAATASTNNGLYYCVVTNSSGSTYSNAVALTVTTQANTSLYNATASTGTSPAPVITTQPLSQTVAVGSPAIFTVAATSATSYQWYVVPASLRNPLETQRAAVSAVADSIKADTTNASTGILTGQTFSDVVMGVTNAGDGNFPFINTTPTYPTGTTGRGVLYGSLNATEQAEVKAMIEAWVNTQASDVAASLLTDYESGAALAQTYVGYQVGSGSADGGTTRCNFDPTINQEQTPINSQNSYLRVDGPRVWIEMVVQAAVAYKAYGFVHYHSLWRDKLADYGNEFGGYLDTTSTDTTYTRPAITAQPAATSVAVGDSATFTVTASGTGTLSYQWYFGTTAIAGATSASYAVTNAATTSAGNYHVVVSNAYGVVTSATAALTVTTSTGETSPTITTQPVSQNITVGNSVSFSVAATGSGTLAYQWYKDGDSIAGATAATYTIAAVALTDAGAYSVVVSNTFGSATSSAATLTVSTAAGSTPVITTEPVSQTITAGNSVTFMVSASSSGTLTYQWYFNGTAISGATNPTYSITTVAATDAGPYYVTVTDTVGSVKSNAATLTVATSTGDTTPTITAQPVSLSLATEESATFSVVATGSGTLSFQWYKDGTAISGATASSYTIASVASTDAGSYTVVVSNSVGSVTSSAATLTVSASMAVVNVFDGSSNRAVEGGMKGIFVFTRTGGDTTSALTVYYKVKGTAANGTRFTGPGGVALTGTAVIPAGASKFKLKVKAVNDSIHESTEKIKLVLKTPADGSYTVGTESKAVVLAIDND